MITNARAIIDSADILSVIGSRIPLKKAGGAHRASCPFHAAGREQRTPSFTVTPARGIWKCFSCQAGGDALRFLQEYDRLEFEEAVEKLAEEVGIAVQYEQSGSDTSSGPARQQLLEACETAAAKYHQNLLSEPRALEYIRARGFTDAQIKRFRFGYARGNSIADCADTDILIGAGILRRPKEDSQNQTPYDPLRGRLIIPMKNPAGKIIAFTGRHIPSDNPDADKDRPKYINTADTQLYSKSNHLFGYNAAAYIIRRGQPAAAIPLIVEGQLKAIACHIAGIPAVAPGGTAFTRRQAVLLARLSGTVAVAMDIDLPGIQAARKTFAVLRSLEIDPQAWRLEHPPGAPPGATDPDDLLAAGLPVSYRTEDWLDWLVLTLQEPRRSAAWGKEIIDHIMPAVNAHPGRVIRHLDTERLAELVQIPAAALRQGDPGKTQNAADQQTERKNSDTKAPQIDPAMNNMRTLCAAILQLPLIAQNPNPWENLISWTMLPPQAAEVLISIARVRQFADRRDLTVSAAIAAAPKLNTRPYLHHWLTVHLHFPADHDQISRLNHIITEEERRRRINNSEI